MRGLSLTQPWAQLVSIGAKRIETRSWSTSYRGPIAIHAAKGFPRWAKDLVRTEPFASALLQPEGDFADLPYDNYQVGTAGGVATFPLGAILAVADLVDVEQIFRTSDGSVRLGFRADGLVTGDELAFGNYDVGQFVGEGARRFGFSIANVRALPEPVPCRGALGLWEVPPDVAALLAVAL